MKWLNRLLDRQPKTLPISDGHLQDALVVPARKPARIKIDVAIPNPWMRAYHTTMLLTTQPYYEFDGRPLNPMAPKLGAEVQAFIDRIHGINGIESVTLNPYVLTITRLEAYEWSDLDAIVIARILEYVHLSPHDVDVSEVRISHGI